MVQAGRKSGMETEDCRGLGKVSILCMGAMRRNDMKSWGCAQLVANTHH